jgi:hypothetical protein
MSPKSIQAGRSKYMSWESSHSFDIFEQSNIFIAPNRLHKGQNGLMIQDSDLSSPSLTSLSKKREDPCEETHTKRIEEFDSDLEYDHSLLMA